MEVRTSTLEDSTPVNPGFDVNAGIIAIAVILWSNENLVSFVAYGVRPNNGFRDVLCQSLVSSIVRKLVKNLTDTSILQVYILTTTRIPDFLWNWL